MKARLAAFTLIGLCACSLAPAQTNSPADQTAAQPTVAASPATDSATAATNSAAETTAAPTTPATADTNATSTSAAALAAEAALVGQTAPAAPAAPAAAVVAPETPAAPEAPAAPAAAPASTATVIPLIQFQDVQLTTAIENLARQANINYILDPKVTYGQPGPDGKVLPQPSISLRWESLTAEQALSAVLNNYGLQLLEDPRTKIARITIKDPAAPDPLVVRVIQLKFASPSNILGAVSSVLIDKKRSTVIADTRTSQLVVSATEKEQDAVAKLVDKLDTQTKQVLIEARLVETSMNPSSFKGLDWSGTLKGQNLRFGNNLQKNSADQSVNNTLSESFPNLLFDTAKGFNPATAFLDADGISAVFSLLNQNSEAKVLSAPRTVTMDNETAHIEVGQNYPIINVTAGTANTTGGSQITYSNLTVRLDVTPRISANNYINLRVSPRVLRLDHVGQFIVNGSSFDVPIFDTRSIDTSVMIPSGNTLVMGGLVQDNQTFGSTKVPILGDIPLVGNAFRSKSKSRDKSNLLVFITPTVVQDNDYQPTKTDFLQTPMPPADDANWSAWDSTDTADWSKQAPGGNFTW